jgi:hypothetical protein
MNLQDEITQLQAKREKSRRAGKICGYGALSVFFWMGPVSQLLGGLTFFVWLTMLICGFIFRSVAVQARDTAKSLEMQLAAQGLTPNLSPLGTQIASDPAVAVAPENAPANPAKAPEANIESRLDKARRLNN